MNTTRIHIRYAGEAEVEESLQDLSNLYNHTEYAVFRLYKHVSEPGVWLVQFEKTPDLEHFAYFVNYLHYHRRKEKQPLVVHGYCYADEKDALAAHPYKLLMVYVSDRDTSYDNVTLVSRDNAAWLYDFEGTMKVIDHPERAFIDEPVYNVTYTFHRSISAAEQASPGYTPGISARPWWKFW